MTPSITEPEVAWYQLSRGNIAAIAAICLLLVGLCVAQAAGYSDTVDLAGKQTTVAPVKINVNRAPAAELMALPGIGERKAERIVTHRVGKPIRSLEDLAAAAGGIPAAHLERIRPYVSFDE